MSVPLASHEVRWFFRGRSRDHQGLREWFERSDPFGRDAALGAPEWKGRLNDEPDVYLLVPGADDLGIKWREGSLQVKGRVADLGLHLLAGRHRGRVERWVKWSYGEVPEAWRGLFSGSQSSGLTVVAVSKTRALRKLRLDTFGGAIREVEAGQLLDRGIGWELTDLQADGQDWCSLAFEAFPDDAALHAQFTAAVTQALSGLAIDLPADQSESYPRWLRRLVAV